MTYIISVGCDIAKIHHRYVRIHDALFGMASFRLALAAMTRRTAKRYKVSLQTLEQLQTQLSESSAAIHTAEAGAAGYQADQLRSQLFEYIEALHDAIVGLQEIYTQLLENEEAYYFIPEGGQSAFNLDKIRYDRTLLVLEKQGSRLNQLFSRF